MSERELEALVRELRQFQALEEEAKEQAEAIRDKIKGIMGDAEEIRAGEYKVTWKSVTSSRLDTAALKKAVPDLVAQFTKTSTTRRFSVA